MPLIIVQGISPDSQEEIGKDIIDALAARGVEPRSCAVIFQDHGVKVFTVDTGYVTPEYTEGLRKTRQSKNSNNQGGDKNEWLEKVKKLLNERKDVSMTEVAYALKISNEVWAGTMLRGIFTDLEQQGLISKVGEKRGTRYILKDEEVSLELI